MGVRAGKMEDLGIDPEFWRGRRVLLTGHTGFKGAWLSFWLTQMGARLRGLALEPPSSPSLFDLAHVADGMEDIRGDIRDAQLVRNAVADFKPDIVIHMAAQSLVRPSYVDPVGTYATNVMGTVHTLDAVRASGGVGAVLVITSDKCYLNRDWDRRYIETDAMGGNDPYSSSKGCAEIVTSAYRHSFFHPDRYGVHGVALASARAGNVIGGGDWAVDRLIPDAMRSFLEKAPLVICFPDAVRPWQHVLEPLSGYLHLVQRLRTDGKTFAEGWNFGPDEEAERPVRYLAERIANFWSDGAQWQAVPQSDAPHEDRYLTLDAGKAHQKLGWRPRLKLDDALRLTVDWFKAFGGKRDMREFTLDQIAAYTAKPQRAKKQA